MASRQERRDRLRQKMQNDSKDKGSGKNNIFNLSDYDSVNFYKTVMEKNEIDIFPFEVTTKNDPEKTPIGDDNYKLDFYRHTKVGPEDGMVLCLLKTFGKPCPICEERDKMIAELESQNVAEPWKNKEVAALKPKRRCVYNIIDLNATDKGMQLYDQSWHMFEKELFARATYKNPDFVLFADFEEGYTIEFKGAKSDFSDKYIQPTQFDFEPRDPYDEKEIRAETFPLDAMLNIPTYDEVQAMFMGVEDEEDDKTQDEESTKKKTTTTRKKKTSSPRTTAKEGRETPARGSRRQKKEDPKPEEQANLCPFNLEHGLIKGTDWANHDECQNCDQNIYDECEGLWNDLEKMRLEREAKEKAEKEDKPTTGRKRNKRR